MESKIFLGKYRVSGEEMQRVGESSDVSLGYRGEDIQSGKRMVVEVVPALSLKMEARERLEARAMAAKNLDHINISALHDFGLEGDRFVYIREDFEGTPVEEWVNMHGPMPVGPVLRIAGQVASALGAAATHQIVHPAINPGNVILVPGQTAGGDWPLVKVLHFVGGTINVPGHGLTGAAPGASSAYVSPEQLQSGRVDFRSEMYSLGSTMRFLLTGSSPSTASTGVATPAPVQPGLPNSGPAVIPQKVRGLLGRMLSVDPEVRPSDPLIFHRQLQDCLSDVGKREIVRPPVGVPRKLETREVGWNTPAVRRVVVVLLFVGAITLAGLILPGYLPRLQQIYRVMTSGPRKSSRPGSSAQARAKIPESTVPSAPLADVTRTPSPTPKNAGPGLVAERLWSSDTTGGRPASGVQSPAPVKKSDGLVEIAPAPKGSPKAQATVAAVASPSKKKTARELRPVTASGSPSAAPRPVLPRKK